MDCINLPEDTKTWQALVNIVMNLTFRRPCIVVYSYNNTNEMHEFLKYIFGIELYMFQPVSLSIIRTLALYTQQ